MTGKLIAMEFKSAEIHFNGQAVLTNLSYAFRKNVITGIIGPSGSGKTTILRTLSRMNDRIEGFEVSGEVKVLGQAVYGNEVDVYSLRQRVGMIFQKPCVFPKSIFENVIFGLRHLCPGLKKEFPDMAEKALREAYLWNEVKDRLDKPAPTLSQGQQQRLAIARTLAVGPEILLMDEPTASLDPNSALAIEDLILSFKGRRTVVLVTHNLEQARRVSDDAVFVCRGEICESGPSRDMFSNPVQEETRLYFNRGFAEPSCQ